MQVWEETFFLPVTMDEITSEEKLSIQLWDSDARSADDILGRVEVDLLELMKIKSKMVRRADKLRGFEEAETMPGEVHWSCGFYRKVSHLTSSTLVWLIEVRQVSLEKQMKERADRARGSAGSAEKRKPDMQPTSVDSPVEARSLDTPPNPKYPSGIFSIVIVGLPMFYGEILTETSSTV
jgi:hypothetical protein